MCVCVTPGETLALTPCLRRGEATHEVATTCKVASSRVVAETYGVDTTHRPAGASSCGRSTWGLQSLRGRKWGRRSAEPWDRREMGLPEPMGSTTPTGAAGAHELATARGVAGGYKVAGSAAGMHGIASAPEVAARRANAMDDA